MVVDNAGGCHSVRIADEVYEPARQVAERRNETMRFVVSEALIAYAKTGKVPGALPDIALSARCGYCKAAVGAPCTSPLSRTPVDVPSHQVRVDRALRVLRDVS